MNIAAIFAYGYVYLPALLGIALEKRGVKLGRLIPYLSMTALAIMTVGMELGIIKVGTPDLWDLPAGAVGIFAGAIISERARQTAGLARTD